MYPMNYYYGPYFRRPVQRLDQGGIPAIRSVAVTTDATNSEVIYNISPCQFRSLPKTGILLLNSSVPGGGIGRIPGFDCHYSR